MTVKIEREALDAYGQEKFDADVYTFSRALKDHAKTIAQPAPTAHPFVEKVVREGGGKYEVIEPTPVVLPEAPQYTLEELQARKLDELRSARSDAMNRGVMLNGVRFSSKLESLTSLLAAKIEAQSDPQWSDRWRVGPGNYVLVRSAEVDFLIDAIRSLHRRVFDRERELSELIISTITTKSLNAIDVNSGWDTV